MSPGKAVTDQRRPKLLLHACCAPCATYPLDVLMQDFDVTVLFYNPNIHPKKEWLMRRDELDAFCQRRRVPLFVEAYDAAAWFRAVKGLEQEPERGRRCDLCFSIRLEKTAAVAAQRDFNLFTTTLTVSPHKNAAVINSLGLDAASVYGVEFYTADFKKKDGFKKSVEISRKEGLYRQDYCGCIYSRKEAEARIKGRV